MLKFLLYTFAGSTIWNTVLLIIGNRLGENWNSILGVFDRYSHIVLVILVFMFFGLVFWFYYKRLKKNN